MLAAAYAVPAGEDGFEDLVVAIELRPGAKLELAEIESVIDRVFRTAQIPRFVRLVESMPMTAGYRVRKQALREQGLGLDRPGETTWHRASNSGRFVPLESLDELEA